MPREPPGPAPKAERLPAVPQGTSAVIDAQPMLVSGGKGRPPLGKRYKWRIEASDRYLWSLGGACNAPMKVDYATAGLGADAPPSAPRQHVSQRQRVVAKDDEAADAPGDLPESPPVSPRPAALGPAAVEVCVQQVEIEMVDTGQAARARPRPG